MTTPKFKPGTPFTSEGAATRWVASGKPWFWLTSATPRYDRPAWTHEPGCFFMTMFPAIPADEPEGEKMVACPDCGGSGEGEAPFAGYDKCVCNKCHGTGKVPLVPLPDNALPLTPESKAHAEKLVASPEPLPALPPLPEKWPGEPEAWEGGYWRWCPEVGFRGQTDPEREADALRAKVEELYDTLLNERAARKKALGVRRAAFEELTRVQDDRDRFQKKLDEARQNLADTIELRDNAMVCLTNVQKSFAQTFAERDQALALLGRLRAKITGTWIGPTIDEVDALLARFPQDGPKPPTKPVTCSNCGVAICQPAPDRPPIHADKTQGWVNADCMRPKKETCSNCGAPTIFVTWLSDILLNRHVHQDAEGPSRLQSFANEACTRPKKEAAK